MKKSQVGVEYLMIIGFVTLITIPLLIIYFTSVQDISEEINNRQVLNIARKIADASESVYFLGEPSQTTLKVFIPSSVQSALIANREIVFVVKTKNGVSDIVQLSSVNMTGTLPVTSGVHLITVKAESNRVAISYS